MPPRHRYLDLDIINFLNRIRDKRATVVTFDPQYRTVMDKLSYGNEGERQKGRASLAQMSEVTIWHSVLEIERILKPSGYLFLWVDKFFLLENLHRLPGTLQKVDLITWHKMKIGMGYRTRRSCEYCVVYQKQPIKAKTTWVRHDIPDVYSEKVKNILHPHTKPLELQKALFAATLKQDDLLVDPCAGSFSSYKAVRSMNIRYLGNDLMPLQNNPNLVGLTHAHTKESYHSSSSRNSLFSSRRE